LDIEMAKIKKCSPKHAGLCHLRRGLTIARYPTLGGARQAASESENGSAVKLSVILETGFGLAYNFWGSTPQAGQG